MTSRSRTREDAELPRRGDYSTGVDWQGPKLVRENMVIGSVGSGRFGTCFVGQAADPVAIEEMLQNMFVGEPPDLYDRNLDFSTAVTGGLFFAPITTDLLVGRAG